MLIIFSIFMELLYFSSLAYLIINFNSLIMYKAAIILLCITTFINIIAFLLMFNYKSRRKYFKYLSIFIIIFCSIFFLFGNPILSIFNIKKGIVNFTIYLYKILFMFSPFYILYFVGLHKLLYKKAKKQLFTIIALKKIILTITVLILMHYLKFSSILYILTILDLFLNFLPFKIK